MRQSTTGRPHQVRKLHDPQILQGAEKGGKGADYPRPSRPSLRAAARRQLPAQTVSAVSDACRTTNALAQNSPAGRGQEAAFALPGLPCAPRVLGTVWPPGRSLPGCPTCRPPPPPPPTHGQGLGRASPRCCQKASARAFPRGTETTCWVVPRKSQTQAQQSAKECQRFLL